MLPSKVRFDRIDGSYDDNNKLKLKNPQKHLYFDRLSERHAIREGSNESAEIANSGEKGLQRVHNRLFYMDKAMDSSDLAISNSGVRPDRYSRENGNKSNY